MKFRQLSLQQLDLPLSSVNLLCTWRPTVNFCQLSMPLSHLLSTSVKFPCIRENFCQLPSTFVQPIDLLSTSINFPCGPQIIRLFPSTFCATRRHSVNFHPLSTRTGNLLSTSVKFSSIQETFHQLPSTFLLPVDLSNSVKFLCIRETFCQFSCRWETFYQFRQISVWPGDLLSTFLATDRPSINLRQLSVPSGDLLSTSIKFPCDQETFRQLPSIFCATERPSVNFRATGRPSVKKVSRMHRKLTEVDGRSPGRKET